MRTIFFLFLTLVSTVCFSQSLRDSLFSGKLKADSAVIANSKINIQKAKEDSIRKTQNDSLKIVGSDTTQKQNTIEAPLKYSDNTKVWKKFVDQYAAIIKSESLPSKKIKKGTYSIQLEYEIGVDGVVTTKNVTSTPSNSFLEQEIKDKMMMNAPKLAPQIVNGAPRVSKRRQVIYFTKEKN